MAAKWNYYTRSEIKENMKEIALAGIKRIIWEVDSLDNDEKVAEIDGIITFLDDIEESMEELDDD